jgi:hypothetical protein
LKDAEAEDEPPAKSQNGETAKKKEAAEKA